MRPEARAAPEIHLDTSFVIRPLVRGSADRRLRQWLGSREPIGISAIAWAELLCGPIEGEQRREARRFLGPPGVRLGLRLKLASLPRYAAS